MIEHIGDLVDAGVDFLTSQLFFDNNTFYSFLYRAGKKNIDVPIIAGVMPVTSRSQIEIVYTAYVFANAKPTVVNMYATNDPDSIAELEKLGLNTQYEWTTDPMVVTLGKEEILPGLETALVGCREGDSVEIYLTYDQAYGKHYVGKVPAKSAVVWYIDIIDVK